MSVIGYTDTHDDGRPSLPIYIEDLFPRYRPDTHNISLKREESVRLWVALKEGGHGDLCNLLTHKWEAKGRGEA